MEPQELTPVQEIQNLTLVQQHLIIAGILILMLLLAFFEIRWQEWKHNKFRGKQDSFTRAFKQHQLGKSTQKGSAK